MDKELKDKAKTWDTLKETNIFDLSGLMLTETQVQLIIDSLEAEETEDEQS